VGRIGRYEVESEIGRGAMGVVSLAHDPRLDRRVAVKTFQVPDGLTEPQRDEYQERFLREARAAASLTHPGIVTVYDVDWDGDAGSPFIAMEYVPGETLKQRLDARGKLDPDDAFELVDALASALGAAHESGIVHRDVKPANVLLRETDGTVKIADFGVARCSTSELTRSGTALGSPAYMSPEQIRGKAVDARSDLFSLAVILYEALSGRRPFEADDLSALAYAIVHETPIPITRHVKGLPAGLDAFLTRALAKDPAERFADADAFRRELQAARRSGPDLESTLVDAAAPPEARAAVGTAAFVADNGEPRDAGATSSAGFSPPGSQTVLEGVGGPMSPLDREETGRGGRRGWVAIVVLALLFLGAAYLFVGGGAQLELDGKSSVAEGELTLHVDGEQVWSRHLAAAQPGNRGKGKKLLNKLMPSKAESFEAWIDVPSGKHEVEARVTIAEDERTYRSSVVVELERGETRKLKLSAGRALGAPVSLKVD
jgi:hypothetical protein